MKKETKEMLITGIDSVHKFATVVAEVHGRKYDDAEDVIKKEEEWMDRVRGLLSSNRELCIHTDSEGSYEGWDKMKFFNTNEDAGYFRSLKRVHFTEVFPEYAGNIRIPGLK